MSREKSFASARKVGDIIFKGNALRFGATAGSNLLYIFRHEVYHLFFQPSQRPNGFLTLHVDLGSHFRVISLLDILGGILSVVDVFLDRMLTSDLLTKLACGDLLLKVHIQFFNGGSFGFWITEVDKDDADE